MVGGGVEHIYCVSRLARPFQLFEKGWHIQNLMYLRFINKTAIYKIQKHNIIIPNLDTIWWYVWPISMANASQLTLKSKLYLTNIVSFLSNSIVDVMHENELSSDCMDAICQSLF